MTPGIARLAALYRRGDQPGFATLLRDLMADRDSPDAIAALARHAFSNADRPIPRTTIEAACLDNQARVHALLANREIALPVPEPVPRALDHLAHDNGPEQWITAQWTNQTLLRQIRPIHRAAVIGTMRDDGLSALEWIAHYRVLGFDRIFIYSNDNIDGSDALLACLADHGIVTHIDNPTGSDYSPQRKAYAHALHLLPALRDYAWVLFADSDEFLVLAPRYQHRIARVIAAVREAFPERRPSGICFQWRWFVSGYRYDHQLKPLLERFVHARDDSHSKSFVRLADVTSMRRLHFPDVIADGFLVDSAFGRIDLDNLWDHRPPVYAGGQLNHYWCKSFEEFSIKKARGDALTLKNNDYARSFEQFFTANGPDLPTNHVPPPRDLLDLVAREIAVLGALPGVAEAIQEIHNRLPAMLRRFDPVGGLAQLYQALRPPPAP